MNKQTYSRNAGKFYFFSADVEKYSSNFEQNILELEEWLKVILFRPITSYFCPNFEFYLVTQSL